MKTCLLASLSAAALWLTGVPQAAAQTVSTGIVQGVAPTIGAMTIRSNETARPITFYEMERATIFSEDGNPAVLSDLEPGMEITVQYAVRRNRWYISKVIIPANEATTLESLSPIPPVYVEPALRIPATRADITHQPGSRSTTSLRRTAP